MKLHINGCEIDYKELVILTIENPKLQDYLRFVGVTILDAKIDLEHDHPARKYLDMIDSVNDGLIKL